MQPNGRQWEWRMTVPAALRALWPLLAAPPVPGRLPVDSASQWPRAQPGGANGITATDQVITAMRQATLATEVGPAACMAAVSTAGGGGEARDSLLATAPLADARDRV